MGVMSAALLPAVIARGGAGASTSGSAACALGCHTSFGGSVRLPRGRRAAAVSWRAQAVQAKQDMAVLERTAVLERPAGVLDPGPPRTRRVAERAIEAAQFADFEAMVKANDVTLVDFCATWCGPCQLMSKILVPIADAMKGQVSVVKVDTDQFPKLATRYNIKALPTLLLFREGRAVDRVEGVMAEAALAKRVRYYAGRMDKKFGRQ